MRMVFFKSEKEQIVKGIRIEMEHIPTIKRIKEYYGEYKKFPKNEEIAEWIAYDHIKENEKYYDALETMEKNFKKEQ